MVPIHSKEEFLEKIQDSCVVVFLFTTKWCSDCLFIKPFLPSIEDDFPDILFYEVDRDQCLDLAIEHEIMGIPSFIAYKDGKEITRFVSSFRKTKEEIEDYLQVTVEKGKKND